MITRRALLACAAAPWLRSQDQRPVYRSETRLVEVYPSVLNRKRQFVDTLTRDDFLVTDDDRPQSIVAFEGSASEIHCALLLDTTGSMNRVFPVLKNASLKLIDALRPSDWIAVYGFNESVRVIHDYTRDKASAKTAVLRTRAGGGTALFDAVAEVSRQASKRHGKRALIVFTDGSDNSSVLNLKTATNAARKVGVPVYSVAQGDALLDDRLVKLLQNIGKLTGGAAYQARGDKDIEAIFSAIIEELQHSYLVAYSPPSGGPDEWHHIKVSIRGHADYSVRVREGYLPE